MSKSNFMIASGCTLAATLVLLGCTEQSEKEKVIRGVPYTVYHTYSTGESLSLGNVDTYSILIDGKTIRCTDVNDCEYQALKYLNSLDDPKPAAVSPDGETLGTDSEEETSFGD